MHRRRDIIESLRRAEERGFRVNVSVPLSCLDRSDVGEIQGLFRQASLDSTSAHSTEFVSPGAAERQCAAMRVMEADRVTDDAAHEQPPPPPEDDAVEDGEAEGENGGGGDARGAADDSQVIGDSQATGEDGEQGEKKGNGDDGEEL